MIYSLERKKQWLLYDTRFVLTISRNDDVALQAISRNTETNEMASLFRKIANHFIKNPSQRQ